MLSSPPLKRQCRTADQPISPPPLRRKTQATTKPTASEPPPPPSKPTPVSSPDRFEIISWNVNSINHLLPKAQRAITSFFSKSLSGYAKQQTPETDDEDSSPSPSSQSPLRSFLIRHNFPAVLCLQEVKISPTDKTTQTLVQKAATSDNGPKYRTFFSLPRDKYNARGWGGKVHGVCTLIRSDIPTLRTETRDVGWDLEGRVLISSFEFSKKAKLVVINGYWPNGTLNVWRDSSTGQMKGTRHDMKRRFHELMLEEVLRWQRGGWEAVLIGDMNIARSPLDGYPGIRLGAEHVLNRADFNKKFIEGEEGMSGVDSWRYVHGEKRGYSYHGEKAEEWGVSCDRVDLGIVSRGIIEDEEGIKTGKGIRLVDANIWESVEERGGSDHVPISVVVDIGKMGRDTQT